MSHAARWVSDADGDAWQLHQAQRQQVSSAVSQGRGDVFIEGVYCGFFTKRGFDKSCFDLFCIMMPMGGWKTFFMAV